MGTEEEGGASCAQPWLLLALLFKHHQETHSVALTLRKIEFPHRLVFLPVITECPEWMRPAQNRSRDAGQLNAPS